MENFVLSIVCDVDLQSIENEHQTIDFQKAKITKHL